MEVEQCQGNEGVVGWVLIFKRLCRLKMQSEAIPQGLLDSYVHNLHLERQVSLFALPLQHMALFVHHSIKVHDLLSNSEPIVNIKLNNDQLCAEIVTCLSMRSSQCSINDQTKPMTSNVLSFDRIHLCQVPLAINHQLDKYADLAAQFREETAAKSRAPWI